MAVMPLIVYGGIVLGVGTPAGAGVGTTGVGAAASDGAGMPGIRSGVHLPGVAVSMETMVTITET